MGSEYKPISISSDSESNSLTAVRGLSIRGSSSLYGDSVDRGVSIKGSHSIYRDSMDEGYLEKVTIASAEASYKLSRTPRLPYPSGESPPSLDMPPMSMEEFGRSLSYN